ncbi:MAG: L-2-amino-thiazoline-4-carboxylic acid hydrolase [Candidatus Brockarchaeota archaeon]|nr:L-2-amino-thiazoline-4-carboxylic acid hydrolase [Candidatus Brockarchaeota archaeon]MBO3801424.1 L-2-amino-thiazoline-4-carboxylic acid hydrolase [Candidatus Brockarchaeota archaeon]
MSELRYYRDFSIIVMSRILEKEFGEEALNLLVEWKNKKIEEEWKRRGQEVKDKGPRNFLSLFSKEAHDFEVVRADEETLEVVVKKCVHAEIFKKFNATDIGKKLICDGDYYVVKGFDHGIELKREKLLMLGDDCCHFIFKLKK